MCEECRQYPCHPRCVNAIEPSFNHYCSKCNNGIYEGEEYIKNDEDEYVHYDCFNSTYDLLDWLGYKIETMTNDVY